MVLVVLTFCAGRRYGEGFGVEVLEGEGGLGGGLKKGAGLLAENEWIHCAGASDPRSVTETLLVHNPSGIFCIWFLTKTVILYKQE